MCSIHRCRRPAVYLEALKSFEDRPWIPSLDRPCQTHWQLQSAYPSVEIGIPCLEPEPCLQRYEPRCERESKMLEDVACIARKGQRARDLHDLLDDLDDLFLFALV